MTDRRFFVSAADWSTDQVRVSGEQAHHLKAVLRARTGESFEFIDGQGRWARAVIEDLPTRGEILCRIQEQSRTAPPDEHRLVLLQALVRFEKLEWIWEKATELGVTCITPLVTAHTEAKWREVSEARFERWQKILVESLKQCRRLHLPLLIKPLRFDQAVRQAPGDVKLLLSEKPGASSLKSVARQFADGKEGPASAQSPHRVTLVVGPEGGWAAEEIAYAEHLGFAAVSLGDLTLRAETAALAALAMARYEFLD